jgi:hypothetical protein
VPCSEFLAALRRFVRKRELGPHPGQALAKLACMRDRSACGQP